MSIPNSQKPTMPEKPKPPVPAKPNLKPKVTSTPLPNSNSTMAPKSTNTSKPFSATQPRTNIEATHVPPTRSSEAPPTSTKQFAESMPSSAPRKESLHLSFKPTALKNTAARHFVCPECKIQTDGQCAQCGLSFELFSILHPVQFEHNKKMQEQDDKVLFSFRESEKHRGIIEIFEDDVPQVKPKLRNQNARGAGIFARDILEKSSEEFMPTRSLSDKSIHQRWNNANTSGNSSALEPKKDDKEEPKSPREIADPEGKTKLSDSKQSSHKLSASGPENRQSPKKKPTDWLSKTLFPQKSNSRIIPISAQNYDITTSSVSVIPLKSSHFPNLKEPLFQVCCGEESPPVYRNYDQFRNLYDSLVPTVAANHPLFSKKDFKVLEPQEQSSLLGATLESLCKSFPPTENEKMKTFLSLSHQPIFKLVDSPSYMGGLKTRKTKKSSVVWKDRVGVVKFNTLYCFPYKDELCFPEYSVPLTGALITPSTSDDCMFSVRSTDFAAQFEFRAPTSLDRHGWVVFLKKLSRSLLKLPGHPKRSEFQDISSVVYRKSVAHVSCLKVFEQYLTQQKSSARVTVTSITFKTDAQETMIIQEDSEQNILYGKQKKKESEENATEVFIRAGTVQKLIEKLTSAKQNVDFVVSFLLTFHSFTTSQYLLEACIHRFRQPCETDIGASANSIPSTQLRVTTVLLKWLEIDFNSFLEDETLARTLVDFIQVELFAPKFSALLKKFNLLIKKQLEPEQIEQTVQAATPPPELPLIFEASSFDIFDLSSVEIARQLALIGSQMYDLILPKECVNQNWNKDKKLLLAPNITRAIDRFNVFSNWVATQILLRSHMRTRVQLVAKFLDIASECLKINNFDSAMAVLAAFNSSAIFRLTKTFEGLPRPSQLQLENLKEVLSVDHNYAQYRKRLKQVPLPCTPFWGLFFTDLTFADQGNPHEIGPHKLINFEKNILFYRVIKDLKIFQGHPYNFQVVPEIRDFLLDLEYLEENELWELSLQVEPREQ